MCILYCSAYSVAHRKIPMRRNQYMFAHQHPRHLPGSDIVPVFRGFLFILQRWGVLRQLAEKRDFATWNPQPIDVLTR